jgi:hypothetical protein
MLLPARGRIGGWGGNTLVARTAPAHGAAALNAPGLKSAEEDRATGVRGVRSSCTQLV